ncbi:hypothetical protein HJC99_00520 [Candidatus Saccharibacteria bacterium]|nr:hypothetical protein [Candidatus Saccharibacteria bacterium]
MNRKMLDKLLSSAGLLVAIMLFTASFGAAWANSFIHSQVHDQLAAEKINFPASGTAGLTSLPAADQAKVAQYAGQQLLTGAQAEVFADNYIAVHLKLIGGGKTYAELSSASLAAPNDQVLVGQVQTVFRGETLRGLLLNAYAFDTMATIALYAAYISFIGGVIMLILSGLGFWHAGTVKPARRSK